MHLPKYARWEHERRFLVPAESARFLADKPRSRRIEDRYLACGRLRLRKVTDSDGGRETCKLTKKYPADSAGSQPIVSVLLSPEEHAALCSLEGADLRKRRFQDEVFGHLFSLDVFEGPLAGLVLCEIEVETRDELERVVPPPYAGAEVTDDPFFCGGRLCRARPDELQRALGRFEV